jgi:hypothetical protein
MEGLKEAARILGEEAARVSRCERGLSEYERALNTQPRNISMEMWWWLGFSDCHGGEYSCFLLSYDIF